ncbi:alanine-zipper protein [Phocaeicola vulgatus]
MSDSVDILKKLALQVRNASTEGENTAERIGRIFIGILENMDNSDIEKLTKYFLRKDKEDSTNFLLSLLGGVLIKNYAKFGDFITGVQGGYIGEDARAELEELNLRTMVKSDNFKAGSLGTGFMLKTDKKTGRSYLEVDELFVRIRALFTELEIRKLTYAGGNWIFSAAGMTCERVEELEDVYRCYFSSIDAEKEVENEFRVGDQARCQEFNVKTGTSQNVSNRYYWRLVVGAGDNYIDLSKTDCDSGSDAPKAGDSIVQLGNRSDKKRQNAIIISAYGEGSPSFTQHKGINSYSLNGTEKTRISPETNILTGEFHFETGEDVKDEIDAAKNTANSANSAAIAANKIAEEAKKNADLAKSESEKANSLLADIANDNKLTAQEKQETKKEWDIIVSEKPKNDVSADKYGVSKSAYGNAYNALSGYITPLLTSLSTTSDIVGTDFRAKFKAYYDARTDLLNAISAKAKELVDAADNKIESVKTELSAVDGKITLAVKTAKEEAISSSKAYTNSEIKVVKDQIALKVDSTTFNALNQKVTEQGSQIALNKNNIEQKVNKSDFNALGTKVSNAETKITQNANKIQQRATKSTVDALTGRVTTAESKITQNANSISLKITASEATNIANNAVNNLQIGGTNLLVNTDFLHNRDYWSGGDVDSSVTLQGRNSLRMITSGLTGDSWRGGEQINTPYLSAKQGDVFTISLFSRTDNISSFDRGASMEIRYYNSSGSRITQSGFNIKPSTNNTWTRFAGTGTCPAGTVKVSAVWYNVRNGRIWVNGIKLEVGKKATDWTRSPHDSPTTQDVKSSFTIDTGGISMLGKKLSLTGMVTFNSLASDAQGKINTAQSTANTAKSAAETAKSTADGANSKATTAQNTANTAKSTADSANSKATTAQNTANTAKSTADAAKTAAANAQSRADAAYNKKIELAQLGTTVISGGFIKTSLIKADEIIVSKLSGATGTFKQLQAVGSDGSVKGTLRLDGDRLWYDGDQYQQGTKDGRSLRYYLSDAWVRGNFGARTRTTLLVQGSSGYFYPKGADKAGVYKSFERGTASDGRTYYKLPCYGTEGDYSGMPVDLIVFNVTSSNQHFYELQLAVTQKVNMINCNNNYTNVLIYCNGNYPGLPGGSVHYAWNVLPFMNPQPTANVLGRGLLFGGSNDNDWR